MTLQRFIEAIAARLSELWPDRPVYQSRIQAETNGGFYVRLAQAKKSTGLANRQHRTLGFEVLYFLQNGSEQAFLEWAETMFDYFDTLTVQEGNAQNRIVRLSGQTATDSGAMAYAFQFEAAFSYLVAEPPGEAMETLQITQ